MKEVRIYPIKIVKCKNCGKWLFLREKHFFAKYDGSRYTFFVKCSRCGKLEEIDESFIPASIKHNLCVEEYNNYKHFKEIIFCLLALASIVIILFLFALYVLLFK